jgi:hypothetical protein
MAAPGSHFIAHARHRLSREGIRVTVTEDEATETEPQPFDGFLGIEWPAASPECDRPLIGWKVTPFNADGPITTITEFTIHATATDLVWAEATMFADEEARPVYSVPPGGKLHTDDEGIVTGTFRFLVTEMRVAAQQPIRELKYAKRGTASNLQPVSRSVASAPPRSTP